MTDHKATILRLATRASGVSRREVRDSFNRSDEAMAVLDQMLKDGEVSEYIRHTGKRPARRIFVERGAGQDWSAGRVQPQHKAKPEKAGKKIICPAGTDYRYTVKELPKNYVSQLNTEDCSAWARAVA